jgi:hypothetical protein
MSINQHIAFEHTQGAFVFDTEENMAQDLLGAAKFSAVRVYRYNGDGSITVA